MAPGTPLRFVVAGVALAAPQVPFAWQACYFQYLHRCLRKRGAWDAAAFCRGRRGTCSTSGSICVAGCYFQYLHRRLRKRGAWDAAAVCRGRRGACSTSGSIGMASVLLSVPASMSAEAWRLGRRCVVVAGVALAALQVPFAWQACYFQYLHIDVCRSVAPGTPLRFVVAGVALAAPQVPFAWQASYFQYLHRCLRKRGAWDAAAVCRGRRETCSTSGSICVAGVLLSVPT